MSQLNQFMYVKVGKNKNEELQTKIVSLSHPDTLFAHYYEKC